MNIKANELCKTAMNAIGQHVNSTREAEHPVYLAVITISLSKYTS